MCVLRGVDQGEIRLQGMRVAQAPVDHDAHLRRPDRRDLRDVERRAARVRPGLQERALERGDGGPFDARAGVEPGHLAPRRVWRERDLVEARVVLVREVAPAEQRDLVVHHDELAMIALLQVRERREARDRLRHPHFDAGPGAQTFEQRVVHAERTVEAVQRIHQQAHAHAALRRPDQRGLDLTPDVVVGHDVDLRVHASRARVDRREQPVARLPVVDLDLDAIARDARRGDRGVETRGEQDRPFDGGRPRQPSAGELVRAQRSEAARCGLVLAAVDDRDDRESRAAQPRGHAREAHRIDCVGHVECGALVEHDAAVDHPRREPGREQPLADRTAAPRRADPHGQRFIRATRSAQCRQLAVRQLGVEEHERSRPRPQHAHPLLDRQHGIGRDVCFEPEHAVRVGATLRRQLRFAGMRRDHRGDPPLRDECDLLIGNRRAESHAGRVLDASAQRLPVVDQIRNVDVASHQGPA